VGKVTERWSLDLNEPKRKGQGGATRNRIQMTRTMSKAMAPIKKREISEPLHQQKEENSSIRGREAKKGQKLTGVGSKAASGATAP